MSTQQGPAFQQLDDTGSAIAQALLEHLFEQQYRQTGGHCSACAVSSPTAAPVASSELDASRTGEATETRCAWRLNYSNLMGSAFVNTSLHNAKRHDDVCPMWLVVVRLVDAISTSISDPTRSRPCCTFLITVKGPCNSLQCLHRVHRVKWCCNRCLFFDQGL